MARHRRASGVAGEVKQKVCTAFLPRRPPLLRAGHGRLKVVSQVSVCRRFGVSHPYLGGIKRPASKTVQPHARLEDVLLEVDPFEANHPLPLRGRHD